MSKMPKHSVIYNGSNKCSSKHTLIVNAAGVYKYMCTAVYARKQYLMLLVWNANWLWNHDCHQLMLTLTLTFSTRKEKRRDFLFRIFEAVATDEQMMMTMTMLWFCLAINNSSNQHHRHHHYQHFRHRFDMFLTIFICVNSPDRDWPKFVKCSSLW